MPPGFSLPLSTILSSHGQCDKHPPRSSEPFHDSQGGESEEESQSPNRGGVVEDDGSSVLGAPSYTPAHPLLATLRMPLLTPVPVPLPLPLLLLPLMTPLTLPIPLLPPRRHVRQTKRKAYVVVVCSGYTLVHLEKRMCAGGATLVHT